MQGIGKDNDDEIVKVIISLAKSLGLQSVAEGVETREQVSLLHEYKCDVMQGYYFCRPMSAEVTAHVLEEILSEDKLEESQCSATN